MSAYLADALCCVYFATAPYAYAMLRDAHGEECCNFNRDTFQDTDFMLDAIFSLPCRRRRYTATFTRYVLRFALLNTRCFTFAAADVAFSLLHAAILIIVIC